MAFIKEESEDMKIEEAFRVKHEDTEEQTEKLVLIVGHNFIKWAERRAEAAWEPDLGLRSTRVQWHGKGGMRWSQLLPAVLATGLRPDVLVIHAGGNDLGVLRSLDLLSSMKEDITALQKITSAKVIFSGITERCLWQWGEGRKMNKARKFINSAMAQYMADTGGVFIYNKAITQKRDLMALKEENGVLNEIKEEDQYMNPHGFTTEEKSYSGSQTETTSIQKRGQKTGNISCFTCQECGRSFTRKGSINRHMRIHTGEKPYSCPQCGKGFHHHESLKVHVSIHTGERPYTCQHCGKGFNRKGYLDCHTRVHNGETPYTCPQCGKLFIRKGNYEDHLRNHIEEKAYTCPQCGKSYIQKGHFKEHIRTHTGEKPFTCQQCGNSFSRKRNLNRHVKTHIGKKSASVGRNAQFSYRPIVSL